MTDSETSAMSERDLLVRIANDSEHTKKSVDKLWEKSDELGTTMSAMKVTQENTTKSIDRVNETLFTGDNALSPRVKVLEKTKPSGSSGFFNAVRVPSVRPASPDAQSGNATIKVLGGIVAALITVLGAVVASR